MNKVFLIGRLTRDPEQRQTKNGIAVSSFTIAVNRPYTQGDSEKKTDFFNCTAWRGLAENITKYTAKGSQVAVVGSVQIREYEDNNGVKRNAVDVICNEVEFLTPKIGTETEKEVPTNKQSRNKQQTFLQAFDDDADCPF